jgi:predicted site-specific integrase-resolvase
MWLSIGDVGDSFICRGGSTARRLKRLAEEIYNRAVAYILKTKRPRFSVFGASILQTLCAQSTSISVVEALLSLTG